MRVKSQNKQKFTLKEQFQQLIQTLRSNTVFQNKPHLRLNPSPQPQLPEDPDVTPITQSQSQSYLSDIENNKKHEKNINQKEGVQYEEVEMKVKESLEAELEDSEESKHRSQSHLLPDKQMAVPINEGRVGGIKHQNTSVNLSLSKKIAKHSQQSFRYSKFRPEPFHQFPSFPQQTFLQRVSIKEINDVEMIKYWNSTPKLAQQSSQSQVYRYFERMMDLLAIDVGYPVIQKYKNCVYFGEKKDNSVYQGVIYYFSQKIYYGEFLAGVKHGHGVEINFAENVKYAGIFNAGSKNGFFFVQKEQQNYEGTLHYGLYHGQGKLITEEWVYQGTFQNGKKHGYGQEFYPKTGLKLQGYFKEGSYQNLNSHPTKKQVSEAQLPSKTSKVVTMERSGSYDMRVQLASKILNSVKSKKLQEQTSHQNQSVFPLSKVVDVPEVQFQSDSKSVYDLINNRHQNKKYDLYLDKVSRKLPKIHLQGLQRRQRSQINPEQSIINKKVPLSLERGGRWISPGKKENSQYGQQNCSTQDLPLFSRKNILNSPIHKL